MRAFRLMSAAAAAGALALSAAPANAVDVFAYDTGWYASAGTHDPGNNNYITGELFNAAPRNWFAFDLSGVQGSVSSATLTIFSGGGFQPGNFVIHDYTGDVDALVGGGFNSGAAGVDRYNDLGTGVSFGSFAYTNADNQQFRTLTLNTSAVAAINSGLGGKFAFGGLKEGPGYLFGSSEYRGQAPVYLSLEFASGVVPEPGTWALMILGFGAAGAMLRRRRAAMFA